MIGNKLCIIGSHTSNPEKNLTLLLKNNCLKITIFLHITLVGRMSLNKLIVCQKFPHHWIGTFGAFFYPSPAMKHFIWISLQFSHFPLFSFWEGLALSWFHTCFSGSFQWTTIQILFKIINFDTVMQYKICRIILISLVIIMPHTYKNICLAMCATPTYFKDEYYLFFSIPTARFFTCLIYISISILFLLQFSKVFLWWDSHIWLAYPWRIHHIITLENSVY